MEGLRGPQRHRHGHCQRQFKRMEGRVNDLFLQLFLFFQHRYTYTRELPGVALENISTGQIFMGKGNILNYIDILK